MPFIAIGQQSGLSGQVVDEDNGSLPGAIVELRHASDSSLAKAGITDDKGEFLFAELKSGSYYLKVSLLGFIPSSGTPISYDGSGKKIAPIRLSPSTVTLKEAQVTGIRPLVEVRPDKTVFNVENSINSTGSTAYELLQKAPGVVVDNNSNIMLKGRGGVLVQIDGRNMRLSQEDLGDYLKSINSTDVESIELISNPSSKYEAQGTAGIINIKLKKNKSFGTNGSVTLGYALASYSKYNTAISINHRTKKVSLFSSYSNNWGTRRNEFYLYREQFPYIFNATSIFKRTGFNHNAKAGVDYTMNKKNVLGIMVTGNFSDPGGTTTSRNQIRDFYSEIPDSILQSDQKLSGHTTSLALNLNHRFADTTGHELTTDFDVAYYDSNRDTYQPNVYTLADYTTVLSSAYYRSVTPTTINIYTLKSDYSQKFLKGKLGLGYKLSFVETDNTFNFYEIIGNQEIIDNARSNQFTYTENVYAGYVNYQRAINNFEFQAGVRLEQTSSEGDLKSAADTTADKNVKRNYLNAFPSAGITYNINKSNSTSLIYSRRIDRPNYQELNPFEWKLDELSFRKGNPFLNPQYSDKVELSHTYKYTTTVSVGYSHTRDFFAQITDTIPGGKSYLTPKNLATEKILSVNLSASRQLMKWYSVYLNCGLYNQKYNADFGEGKTIDASVTNFNLYMQNTIRLPKNFTLEISGWYNSSGVWGGSFVTKAQGSLDVGLQKKLFDDQATLKVSYSDILDTAPWDSHSVYGGIVLRASGNWESQQFRASFSWRFGNRQMQALRQRKSGSESEQKRIGGGD